MKYLRRMTRQEKHEMRVKKMENSLNGEGKYLFKNNTKGELKLPKPSLDNKKIIPINGTFLGDDYFMQMVKTNDLLIVSIIENKQVVPVVEEKTVPVVEEKTVAVVETDGESQKKSTVMAEKTKEKINNKESSKKTKRS